MNYWILQMNPNSFLVDRNYSLAREQGKTDWWGITRYLNKVEKCDIAFIWHSKDYRKRAKHKESGIYAQAQVLCGTHHSPDEQKRIDQLKQQESPQFLDSNERTKQEAKPSILIKYDKSYVGHQLTKGEIVSAGLSHICIITFSHQGICPLSESDAAQIMKLLENKSTK